MHPVGAALIRTDRWTDKQLDMMKLISNFTEMHPVGAALICTDRWTDKHLDMTKLIGALCKYSKVPAKWTEHI